MLGVLISSGWSNPLEAVYEAADAAGAPSVYWLTQHFNEAGRRLYDKVGTLSPFIKYDRPKP